MKYFLLLTAFLFFTCLSFAQDRNFRLVKPPVENSVANQKRKAVVIGMSDYGGANTLDNTINDANDMANVLTQLGFEVTLLTNNDLQNLDKNLTDWYNTIEGNDMAVFYYAGHGMEIKGENYLIPIGAVLKSEVDVKWNTLDVNKVLDNMDAKNVNMKLIILDACRNNEFSRSWSRGIGDKGLGGMSEIPDGTYIAFATAPKSTAQDGGTYGLHNGIFTYYLKQEILKPDLSISDIFDNVATDVYNRTDKQQLPYRNNGLVGKFYFTNNNKSTPDNSDNTTEWLRQASALFKSKQYAEAFALYKQAADKGNATGQNNLGLCYENGYGVTKDINQAIAWYKKAAGQGNINAQSALDRLQNNSSMPVNPKENPNKPANETSTSQANNAQMSTNVKIETPNRRMEMQLISTELIENEKNLMVELILTNHGQDLNYMFYGGVLDSNSMAYDNLGNRMKINVIWGEGSTGSSGMISGNIPGNIPISIKVVIYNINPRATSLKLISIGGQSLNGDPTYNGNFILKNVPIR